VSRSVLRTVDVHVQRIRTKLGLSRNQRLTTVSGRGYRWSDPA
jgi:DNA-binding response OmpR family regulator